MKALIFDLDGTLLDSVYAKEDEHFLAGAFRMCRDVAELHRYLDELGVLP